MKFDYYIYVDYSKNLVGYIIIEKEKINEILPKISKLRHYKNVKHSKQYISAIKKRFRKNNIKDYLLKYKVREFRLNFDILIGIVDFFKKHRNAKIFMSIDNTLYRSFMRLLKVIEERDGLVIVKESKLKKDTLEYKLSLIIDNILNIERSKSKQVRQSY